jgi:hypothetical protein
MRLKPGAKVYWRAIVGTMALGYQRRHAGSPGRWIARSYVGDEKYRQTPIAMADDYEPSNGGAILTFEEASERVRQSHRTNRDRPLSVLTVADAIADYIIWLTTHRATWRAAGKVGARAGRPRTASGRCFGRRSIGPSSMATSPPTLLGAG